MKKLGLLVALAMIAGSASAALILSDADWASTYKYTDGGVADGFTGAGTLDSVVDGSGAMDVEISVTVDAFRDSGAGYNFGTVYTMVDLAAPVAGTVWNFDVQRITDIVSIWPIALVDGGGFVQGDIGTAYSLDGSVESFSYDLSGHTTIESVGLIIFAAQAGIGVDGPQATIAVPEPATFGMMALVGGGILFIRKKFMI